MILESLLCISMLSSGTFMQSKVNNQDALYRSVVENTISNANIDLEYQSLTSDVPMLLLNSTANSDSNNSFTAYTYTYDYYNNLSLDSSYSYGYLYYNQGWGYETSFYTFMSIYVGTANSKISSNCDFTINIRLTGSFNGLNTSYYIYDYNNQSYHEDIYLNNGTINFSITGTKYSNSIVYNNSQGFTVNSNGWLNLCIFHFTQSPYQEYVNNTVEYEVVDYSYSEVNLASSYNTAASIKCYIPNTIYNYGDYPIVMTLHGGNWQQGYGTDYYTTGSASSYHKYFMDNGYAQIDINYRLVRNLSNNNIYLDDNQPTAQDMLYDINCAIDYVINNYSNILDTNNIILWGYSAGAHLAMMYSYGGFIPTLVNSIDTSTIAYHSQNISKVVSEAGPTYFLKGYLDNLMGTNDYYPILSYLVGEDILLSTNIQNSLNKAASITGLYNPYSNIRNDLKSVLTYNISNSQGDTVIPKASYDYLVYALNYRWENSSNLYTTYCSIYEHNEFYLNAVDNYFGLALSF